MSVSEQDRRCRFEPIAEAIGERAAQAMSDMADDDDPGLVAGLDQQDTTFDALRYEIEELLHREVGAAIASQTRTVLLGILAVTAAMFAMLITVNQVL